MTRTRSPSFRLSCLRVVTPGCACGLCLRVVLAGRDCRWTVAIGSGFPDRIRSTTLDNKINFPITPKITSQLLPNLLSVWQDSHFLSNLWLKQLPSFSIPMHRPPGFRWFRSITKTETLLLRLFLFRRFAVMSPPGLPAMATSGFRVPSLSSGSRLSDIRSFDQNDLRNDLQPANWMQRASERFANRPYRR